MAPGIEELLAGEHEALSIAELYQEVEDALARVFPKGRGTWVRGEVQSLSDRTGHCYLDLVDPDSAGDRQAPVLKVKCWRNTWGPLKATLARQGVDLQPGMVVVIRGNIDFYRPRGEVGFILNELDVTALLGRLAAERAALLRALVAEGLFDLNRQLALPDVPLRVGLVASPGTEGFRDFLGQLEGSGFAFNVVVSPATVQGAGAPASVASALGALAEAQCDLAVVVRGGGSKADLAAFDSEAVARAIATSSLPVWTGIGHTGDESVADLVANRSFITPTECGRELAALVGQWWDESVVAVAERIGRRAKEVLVEAERRDQIARGHLTSTARHQLRWHRERLVARGRSLEVLAPQLLDTTEAALVERGGRLVPLALGHLDRAEERAMSWRRLLSAYNVERQLERGYTLTVDGEGHVVRQATDVGVGDVLRTRFADGSVDSVVRSVEAAGPGHVEDRAEEAS